MPESESENERKKKWTRLEDQVAGVIIRKRVLAKRSGPCLDKYCGCDCYYTKNGLENCYYRSIFMVLTGLIMFIAFLVWLVVPYIQTLSFIRAECTVYDVDHISGESCKCGSGCYGRFPCLVVKVRFRSLDGKISGRGMLHDVEFGGKCSFTPPCRPNEETNREAVWQFRRDVKAKNNFRCYIDPNRKDGSNSDSGYIMRGSRLGTSSTVNLLLWPLLMIVIFTVWTVIMCCTCGCKFVCDSKPPEEITISAARIMHAGTHDIKDLTMEEREALVLDTCPEARSFFAETDV